VILVLGGTSEARSLAEALVLQGVPVVSSLAGRVARPRLPAGEVRIGGFGGAEGLRDYLSDNSVSAVVDATHPFSEQISRNAARACADATPLLRLERPGWASAPGADGWHWVDTHQEAGTLTATLGDRPLLTVGRQPLSAFVAPLASSRALVRVVDAPSIELPPRWTLLQSRGPYDVSSERSLFSSHDVDVLVTKDSGGAYTWPKMQVARELDVPVVVVRRSPTTPGVETVTGVEAAAQWCRRHA
jgi:precorrin-6A/cobalt-precorrin-6A reductase